MISDRKQYIGIKNNIVFELFQFLFMLEWFLACISRFSAHIPTSFSVFMPNICCLDKLDNKHYAYRLIMMWEYGQKNEKYWPGSIPAHIRIGKVLNVVIFDTNNCLFPGPCLPSRLVSLLVLSIHSLVIVPHGIPASSLICMAVWYTHHWKCQ